jgi:Ser/Thr protein kinase RdoA (MazF antagonist)
MNASSFPVQSSLLSPEALAARLLPAYALPQPRHCRVISRSMNDTYQVTAGTDTFYLRISRHGTRTREEIVAELACLADLHHHGLSVAPPLARSDGAGLTSLLAPEGERFAVLFPPAAGQSVRDISPPQSRAYGRLAATIHHTADAIPTPYRRFPIDERHLLDAPLAAIRAVIRDGGEDLLFLEQVAARVRRHLEGLPRSSPAYGLCHGDLHPGNVHFDTAGQPTLFDFDCLGYGWRAYDLTVFLWNAYGERRPKRWRESRWQAFLRGYREVRQAPEGLDEVLPLFLVARQVWLMGLDGAGHSGWLPQWLTPEWLQEMVRPVRSWVSTYPILAD